MTSVRQLMFCYVLSLLLLVSSLRTKFTLAHSWNSSTNSTGHCKIYAQPNVTDLAGANYTDHVRLVTLPSGRTYRYVHYLASSQEKPTLVLLHGFPSSSFDWRNQFQYFASRGYGVVAPDALGYGGTDKPLEPEAYTLKKQVDDVIDLLDCVGVGKIVTVGHDLGSPVLSRMNNYYPNRSQKFIFLDIGYQAPGQLVTAAVVATTPDVLGYWIFFNETGTGAILDKHQESFWSIAYTNNEPGYYLDDFTPPGKLEAFLREDHIAPTGGFVSAQDEAIHNRIFAASRGGYEPTLNHYRGSFRNLNLQDDNSIPATAYNLSRPVLLITASKDPIGTPGLAENTTRPFAPDLRIQELDSGHFVMLEKAAEVNEAIRAFLEE